MQAAWLGYLVGSAARLPCIFSRHVTVTVAVLLLLRHCASAVLGEEGRGPVLSFTGTGKHTHSSPAGKLAPPVLTLDAEAARPPQREAS